MKTTLDLPDDLIKDVKRLAVNEGKKLKDAMADLLRKGLAVAGAGSKERALRAERSLLQRRKEIAEKFISGEWGVELTGYEAGRATDRQTAQKRAKLWRK
jgi:hypothetical protein